MNEIKTPYDKHFKIIIIAIGVLILFSIVGYRLYLKDKYGSNAAQYLEKQLMDWVHGKKNDISKIKPDGFDGSLDEWKKVKPVGYDLVDYSCHLKWGYSFILGRKRIRRLSTTFRGAKVYAKVRLHVRRNGVIEKYKITYYMEPWGGRWFITKGHSLF